MARKNRGHACPFIKTIPNASLYLFTEEMKDF